MKCVLNIHTICGMIKLKNYDDQLFYRVRSGVVTIY